MRMIAAVCKFVPKLFSRPIRSGQISALFALRALRTVDFTLKPLEWMPTSVDVTSND